MTKIHDLNKLGQSIWYDNIRRALLDSGELQALIDDGVSGVTSNPSIFEKAIAGSTDYDEQLHQLVDEGKQEAEIFDALALEDIRRTADLLRPIYDRTEGADGFVSLEVNPLLAADTESTIEEVRRLFAALDRPNVMIKVPATPEVIPAVETLTGEGINVNITLMFSLAHYDAVAEAYIAGLEKLAADGGDVGKVASVASFFVSRVDSAIDAALDAIGETELQGKIAVANAKLAYARYKETFSGDRWDALAEKGARVQRVLWASTSTKNPTYPDLLYIDTLIGPDTINTVPPNTLQALLDRATVAEALEDELDEARAQIEELGTLGIDLDAVTQKLQDDGVAAFSKSFESLMGSIAEKRERLLAGWEHISASLNGHQKVVDEAVAEMAENEILKRIWALDHTVWRDDPAEITNRLGWLRSAEVMADNLHRIESLVSGVKEDGYTQVLLLGMGGSSLAPEVFRETYDVAEGHLDLAVLDSTDADAVRAEADRLDLSKTLFIVATKSGGTVETLSFFKYFYNRVTEKVGQDEAGQHFVAITDGGSKLQDIAERYAFRATFLNDPKIGGRYSALSYFGLVPAALLGVDLPRLLDRALTASHACDSCVSAEDNPGLQLGAIMGELAKAGRDKLTFITSPAFESFGDWVEQLIAESTGKNGTGILPVVREPVGSPDVYGDDRLFVYLHLDGDGTHDNAVDALEKAGHPIVRLHLHDLYDLGGQFFLWEMATAVAGHRLGIHPFNQPNVEAAKVLAREMVTAYTDKGALPEDESASVESGVLNEFVGGGEQGAYIAIHAYVQPTEETGAALDALRVRLRDATRLATTVGYGPRFLHSTGQLHKGDGGNGLFIQFTSDPEEDAAVPDEAGSVESSISFGVLKQAQALGDGQALRDAGRKVIRFHLGTNNTVADQIRTLAEGIS